MEFTGSHRQAVETVCRVAASGHHPLPMHARAMVFKLADRISVLVYGRVIACGDPDSIRNNPDVRTAYLGEHDLVA